MTVIAKIVLARLGATAPAHLPQRTPSQSLLQPSHSRRKLAARLATNLRSAGCAARLCWRHMEGAPVGGQRSLCLSCLHGVALLGSESSCSHARRQRTSYPAIALPPNNIRCSKHSTGTSFVQERIGWWRGGGPLKI